MFSIKVTDTIIKYVEDLLQKYNFGKRGYADGSYEEQRIGLIGQTVIQNIFNCGNPTGGEGFNGGEDFSVEDKVVDVKTMGRTVDPKPNYVNNFMGLQKNYKSDILIFCSFNKKTKILTVCGWIPKKEFFRKASFYERGTRRYRDDGTYFVTKTDLYEIENYKLNSPRSIHELIEEIKSFET